MIDSQRITGEHEGGTHRNRVLGCRFCLSNLLASVGDAPMLGRIDCECGEFILTNDPYMIDAWNEWHEAGAFLAGKYHKPIEAGQE